MKTITLSADERLIDAARRIAAGERATLEAKFREWLEGYAAKRAHAGGADDSARQRKRQAEEAIAVIRQLRRKYPPQNRKFTREEMNERG